MLRLTQSGMSTRPRNTATPVHLRGHVVTPACLAVGDASEIRRYLGWSRIIECRPCARHENLLWISLSLPAPLMMTSRSQPGDVARVSPIWFSILGTISLNEYLPLCLERSFVNFL